MKTLPAEWTERLTEITCLALRTQAEMALADAALFTLHGKPALAAKRNEQAASALKALGLIEGA